MLSQQEVLFITGHLLLHFINGYWILYLYLYFLKREVSGDLGPLASSSCSLSIRTSAASRNFFICCASSGRQRRAVPQLELMLRGTGTILNSHFSLLKVFSAFIA